MKYLGGYFELELSEKPGEFYKDAIKLNTGRNAFKYLLKSIQPDKVHIPFYRCEALLEPLNELSIPFQYYSIDEIFRPNIYSKIGSNDYILYINYFGINEQVSHHLLDKWKEKLILDYSQAFFSNPISCAGTFYSVRKFFGVPDGSYLFTSNLNEEDFNQDTSFNRCTSLLKRLDIGAEAGYDDFLNVEKMLSNQPIKEMSSLTTKILSSIDYEYVQKQRNINFSILHNYFLNINELKIDENINSPLTYPLLIKSGKTIKHKFIDQKIFLPTYWKSVKDLVKTETFEYHLVDNLLCLPIDQRYNEQDMEYIISVFKSFE